MTDIAKLKKDCQDFRPIIEYIFSEELPQNSRSVRKITAQTQSYVRTDYVLHHFYAAYLYALVTYRVWHDNLNSEDFLGQSK
mgnify:CR=1 FL=1